METKDWSTPEERNNRLQEEFGISLSFYSSVHHWIKKNYGKASKCTSKKCSGISRIYNWALVRGKNYEYKRENFIELCRACHSKYDFTEKTREKVRKANLGLKATPEAIEKRRKALKGIPLTKERIENIRKASHKKPVCRMDENYNVLETYPSTAIAGIKVGRARINVAKAAKSGGLCAGFRWKFVNHLST